MLCPFVYVYITPLSVSIISSHTRMSLACYADMVDVTVLAAETTPVSNLLKSTYDERSSGGGHMVAVMY